MEHYSFLGGCTHDLLRITKDHEISNGKKLRKVKQMRCVRSAYAAISRKNKILICGGEDEYHKYVTKIAVYDIDQEYWGFDDNEIVYYGGIKAYNKGVRYESYISAPRKYCGVALFGPKSIIVYGGKNKNTWLNDVEMIHLVSNEDGSVHEPVTNFIPPMHQARSHFVYPNTIVPFAIGGFDGNNWLDTVEQFDFRTGKPGKWNLLDSKMSIGRAEIMSATCQYSDKVYLCGGWNYGPLNTFEILDLYTGIVHTKNNMLNRRVNGYCINFGEKIVIVGGGKNENGNILPFERYDSREGKWEIVKKYVLNFYDMDALPNKLDCTVVKHNAGCVG